VYDHIIHVSEVLETAKDMQVALLELNISNVNNSMNRVMKTLTIVATIFIPLTFVAGIYGMNFKYMPELEWEWGYPAILAFMLILAALMIWYIRRKGWF
jgi:magnesium transporter